MLYQNQQKRSGIILLVVLALLSLFAIVGLSFVFYADAEAVQARAFNESLMSTRADVDPEMLMAFALGQIIYDTDNPYSALRGHSLSRTMYGRNPAGLNHTPYNGVGRDAIASPMAFPAVAALGIPAVNTDAKLLVNNTKFEAGANPTNDPWLNFARTPEFFGKQGDANYRFVGGANPPWTSFDTNSMFLAQVDANGNVLMPSFHRPWTTRDALGNPIPANSQAAKYAILRPHQSWHPQFVTPDQDATGDVKNLDFGPGGNDSIWLDLGFPVMTAPNGKRYKPLFAPLILDLSNRIHLWAHGNIKGGAAPATSHVSNHGFGATEVNVALRQPGISAVIAPDPTGAVDLGAQVEITTTTAHGFAVNQQVVVAGVRVNGYNGLRTITQVTPPFKFRFAAAGKLGASGYGTVTNAEFAQLFNLKYGANNAPNGTAITFPTGGGRGGLPVSLLDFDGRGMTNVAGGEQSVSSRPIHFGFAVTSSGPVIAGVQPMPVSATFGVSYGGFHWSIYPGMVLNVIDPGPPNRSEPVTVTSVNYGNNTFTANFKNPHPTPGVQITFGSQTKGFPDFPVNSYTNLNAAELNAHPMKLDLTTKFNDDNLPSIATMEALLRWGHTGGPANQSEVFRRMPQTFLSLKARNSYTTLNWGLDRIGSSPLLTFDRLTTQNQYVFNPNVRHPQLVAQAPATPGALTSWPNSDFTADPATTMAIWRSVLSQRLRVDLNRRLTDYPTVPAAGLIALPNAAYTLALTERQTFAKDIYNALLAVTGARDPNNPGTLPAMVNTSPEYQAARWLAQLAVNIVDFVDADDYNTPFNWHPASPNEWVFGTELPRLVLNEIYAQREQTDNHINVWAELLNPYSATTVGTLPNLNGAATLQYANAATGAPPYKIDLLATTPALTAFLRDPSNNKGDPAATTVVLSSQTDWGGTTSAGFGVVPLATTRSVAASSGAAFGGATIQVPIAVETADPLTSGASANVNVVTIRTTVPAPNNFVAFQVGQAVTITGVQSTVNGPMAVGYEGTYVITSKDATNTSITFECPTPNLPLGGGGIATIRQNGNQGYYVIGPAGARYPDAARNPQFPATYVAPTVPASAVNPTRSGMTIPLAQITPPILIGGPTVPGVSLAFNMTTNKWIATVTTVDATGNPAPHPFQVNENVIINGVVPAPVGMGHFNGMWTVASIAPNQFTFEIPAAYAMTINPAPPPYGNGTVQLAPPPITILLRRLANPHLPAQVNPALANYNPYITIDYLDGVQVEAIIPTQPVNLTRASGRKQPYAAFNNRGALAAQSEVGQQTTQPAANQPFNTMFTRNSNATPFDWLVHLDRPLVNPLELLHVSGYKPHELTQQFKQPLGVAPNIVSTPFQHLVPWNDQASMLYRAFELFGTANHMAGSFNGGRHAGKININTMTDFEIFQALCDPQEHNQPNPLFNSAQLNVLFQNLVASRNGGAPGPGAAPQNDGNPFQPLSAGNINKTIFRPDPSGTQPSLFSLGAAGNHPYHRAALLQKIYNNMTTTSNCFAVFVTVGFFEVVDESVRPPRLGAEIGRDQNRHVRHRFFSLVDRTALEVYRGTTIAPAVTVVAANALPQTLTMTYNAATFNSMGVVAQTWAATKSYASGEMVTFSAGAGFPALAYVCVQAHTTPQSPATSPLFWQPAVQPGMLVEVVTGGATEVVTIKSVGAAASATANTFTADFMSSHAAGSTIILRGNPGPQPVYNPRKDTNVVLHTSVIQ